ncbi:hypothetical protein LQZ19_11445 [Treponema primitia]|uniref:hypothetical protein n=1 Tax=Treponema primitia TaxID=88058 RepID=UPI00397F4448
MGNFDTFIEAVKKYAEVYKQFEDIQKDKTFDFVPKTGDQKTGLIGEAYIFEYLKRQGYPDIEFGGPSQKGWDIRYPFDLAIGREVLVQVKTVSAYSKTRAISPIHLPSSGYWELFLVSLNGQFIPDNIWRPTVTAYDTEVITGTRMPKNDQDFASGFTEIENVFEHFKSLFPELYSAKAKTSAKPKAAAKLTKEVKKKG